MIGDGFVISTPFGCRGLDVSETAGVFQAEMDKIAEKLELVVNQSSKSTLDAMSACVRTVEGVDYNWHGIAMDLFEHMVTVCGNCSE